MAREFPAQKIYLGVHTALTLAVLPPLSPPSDSTFYPHQVQNKEIGDVDIVMATDVFGQALNSAIPLVGWDYLEKQLRQSEWRAILWRRECQRGLWGIMIVGTQGCKGNI